MTNSDDLTPQHIDELMMPVATSLAKGDIADAAAATAAVACHVTFGPGAGVVVGAAVGMLTRALQNTATRRIEREFSRLEAEARTESERKAALERLVKELREGVTALLCGDAASAKDFLGAEEIAALEEQLAENGEASWERFEQLMTVMRRNQEEQAAQHEQTRREVVERVVDVVKKQAASQIAPAPRGLYGRHRQLSQIFVGRDLEPLAAYLRDKSRLQRMASVEGLSGVGKTEFALQIAHELHNEGRFPGGVYWLDAERSDLTSQWADLAEQLGVAGDSSRERANRLLGLLSTDASHDVLVVLDNVLAWSEASAPKPLPTGSHVAILATTTTRGLGGAQFQSEELSVLRPPADHDLLTGISKCSADQVGELLHFLEGHPLALGLAGRALAADPFTTPNDYLKLLQQRNPLGPHESIQEESPALERTLQVAWARLGEKEQHAWTVASCFGQAPATAALASRAGIDRATLVGLFERHLIEHAQDSRWTMHSLVRAYGRRELEGQKGRQILSTFIYALRAASLSSTPWELREDLSHYNSAVELGGRLLGPRHPATLYARQVVTEIHYALGDYSKAHELGETLLQDWSDARGEDSVESLGARHSFCKALLQMGKPEDALKESELIVAKLSTAIAPDAPQFLAAQFQFASCLLALGRPAEAESILRQVAASRQKIFGPTARETLNAKGKVATALYESGKTAASEAHRAKLQAASDLQKELVEAWRDNFAQGDPDALIARGNYALTLSKLGRHQDALREQQTAYVAIEKAMGVLHPDTLTARANFASSLHASGDVASAKDHRQVVWESRRRVLGLEHRMTLEALNNLVHSLLALKKLDDARALVEEVWETVQPRHGEESLNSLLVRDCLAVTLFAQGDSAAALGHVRKVAAGYERILGAADEKTMQAKRVLNWLESGPVQPGSSTRTST